MKSAVDLLGNIIEIEDSVITKNVNGINYLLTEEELAEITERQSKRTARLLEIQLEEVRTKRKPLLEEADILINKAEDTGVSTVALRVYRQALRDITTQVDLNNIVWPVKP